MQKNYKEILKQLKKGMRRIKILSYYYMKKKALIGYACIIPITKMLADKILEDDELYDDNITSADILEYKKGR